MSNRRPIGIQVPVITPFAPQIQESFDLNRLDIFVTSLGVDFSHFRAMISPLGKNDIGEIRKNDGVDQITSNGMLYRCAGIFTATMTDNAREQKRTQSGVTDPAESRLVMPRFYTSLSPNNCQSTSQDNRIYLMPGDRLYLSDPDADVLVANVEEIAYQPDIDNEAMFPIVRLQEKIIDSRNVEYTCGTDFEITQGSCMVGGQSLGGNIRWLPNGNNPGIDPLTGKGRVFSIRYLYKAFYYVMALPKEVRVTNVTGANGVRAPQRAAMHAIIVREYVFHQQNRGDKMNQLKPKTQARTIKSPVENILYPNQPVNVDISNVQKIDMSNIENGDDENE